MRGALVQPQNARPKVRVFWGDTGTGKSHAARKMAREYPGRVWFMSTPTSTRSTPWIDGYNGQEVAVLEDFAGGISYRILLRMLDEYENPMQVKSSMVQFCPKLIIITSNLHPRRWYMENDWETGPLRRRLETDKTGEIKELTVVWKAGPIHVAVERQNAAVLEAAVALQDAQEIIYVDSSDEDDGMSGIEDDSGHDTIEDWPYGKWGG